MDDVTVSALISESDWLRLRAALRHMDEISMGRSLGAVRVQAILRDIMTNEFIYFVIGLVLGMLLGWLVCR